MSKFVTSAIVLACAGAAHAGITTIDFEFDSSNVALPAGTEITNQFAGMTISAINGNASHPDKAILFDTANPTGEDNDLATPGYHATNTVPYGKVLIIAEDDVDGNADGLVDDPDDEAAGGTIFFVLNDQFDGASIDMIDIEEQGSIDFVLGGSIIGSSVIPAIGDNSVQTVGFTGGIFDEVRINLAGSGAVGAVTFVPAPGSLSLIGLAAIALRRRR